MFHDRKKKKKLNKLMTNKPALQNTFKGILDQEKKNMHRKE
jgi:hypothetical protein